MLNRYLRALDSGATVITANARLARVIRREYGWRKRAEAEAGGAPVWASPAVMPWTSWLESQWRQVLYLSGDAGRGVRLQPAQEAALWEDVIAASDDASALLDLPATARSAITAWNLIHEWRLDLRHPAWEESEDAAAFLGWARQFQARCGAGNWLSGSAMADSVMASTGEGPSRPSKLLFAAFDEFTPRQLEMLAALRQAGTSVDVVEPSSGETGGEARRLGLADTHAELAAAAQWSRVQLAANPETSIAVIIPGLSAVRSEVERIFTDVLHPSAILPGGGPEGLAFDISLGLPLADYPLVHAVLMAIELGTDPVPLSLVGNLLRSPFLRGGDSEAANRALLDAALRGRGGLDIGAETLQKFAENPPARSNAPPCPVFAEALRSWHAHLQPLPVRQSCSRWAADFSRLGELLGWPGERKLNSDEFQTLEKWQSLLDEFAAIEAVAAPRSYRQAAAILRHLAHETIFQPESSEAPIRVMGVLEAAGQQFDHVWIAGLHDGAWPPAANPHPFIPGRLQREHGLPSSSASRELAYTERITNRLVASAPDVVVSFPRRDGDLALRPSRLIADFPETSLNELVATPVPTYASVQFGCTALERKEDSQAPAILVGNGPGGGTRILKEQAACPFRAFATLRLHAQPLDVPQAGLTALERGNLVHGALENIWKILGSRSALDLVSESDVVELVRSSVGAALRRLVSNGAEHSSRVLSVESELLEKLLIEWLGYERTREPFSILHLEHREHTQISGVEMNLRADRIDRLDDGRHVLIDYKTGSPSPAQWEGDRPDEPQLPLYAVSSGLDLAAVAFAQVKRGDLRFKGSATSGVLPGTKPSDMEWTTQLAEWRQVLEKLAADFRDGVAAVDPKHPGNGQGKTCQYCGLQPFCRIAEAAFATDDESEDEIAGAAHA